MGISIVILSYYRPHRLKTCLDSVLRDVPGGSQIIVIDNSVDNKAKIEEQLEIKQYLEQKQTEYPDCVEVVFNDSNLKFSRGMNQGIGLCKNQFIFLLNNDIEIVTPNTFSTMANCFSEGMGSLTPVTKYSNGHIYCSGAYGKGRHKRDQITEPRETEWNNFAFICIPREVFTAVGLLETGKAKVPCWGIRDCSHYHSDHNWCQRASDFGYEHWVHPIIVNHYHKED